MKSSVEKASANWGDERIESGFWNRCTPEPNSGCWLWHGKNTYDGYGHYTSSRPNRKTHIAHRYAFTLLIGRIQDGLQIDHLCRVRCCVNPAHLEPVTKEENQRRGLLGVLKTHCKSGHEFTAENTYVWTRANGATQRCCRACNRRVHNERKVRRAQTASGVSP